ncbi:MAG: XisI protein [Leptolyngbyaceae cyanobacterium RU_5_1]|nr:XisI protein [Leptolyngbyaceae cyanobacterium RU_5_1]
MAVEVVNASHEVVSKVDRYRQVVLQFLLKQSDEGRLDGIESQPIFDQERDRYLILSQGWRGQERVYWVVMHLELRGGKVWIQRNQTEVDIEAELMALDIPQADIVLGIIPPEYRTLAGFTEA